MVQSILQEDILMCLLKFESSISLDLIERTDKI